ncbi:Erythromycin biosynthesis sensory transduction protein eryC1 [Azospirillaceae bacterium]
MIPFVNMKRQLDRVHPALRSAFEQVVADFGFIQGRHVDAFARAFCLESGFDHGVGCSNGTSALRLALEALGVGPGDEVVTSTTTFIATVEAIHAVGATPRLVDIDPGTYCLDLQKVEAAIGKKTRALIPVHLYGNCCDIEALMSLARCYDLKVIEDCAQSHLGKFRKRPLGAFGDAGAFSFYPGKNLGALGDAGMVVSSRQDLIERVAQRLDHGRSGKYEHKELAGNDRMDGLQAAFLSAKLTFLKEWTKNRQEAAKHYDQRLRSAGFKVIEPLMDAEPVYHLYEVEFANRKQVQETLTKEKIGCGVHYPLPLHRQPALAAFACVNESFPVAERAAERLLSLPMCGEITLDEVDHVCDVVLAVGRP